jgi:uncharacterized protein DUF4062/NACHT domain-containing protein
MDLRKEVFISGTSADLGSYRQAAKEAVLTLGAHPIEEKNFPTDYRDLQALLGRRLDPCDAVIHLVGFYYGGEPETPPDAPRRSWTQWEYYRATEGERPKPVYRFLARENCNFDAQPTEDAEKQRLQREHREHLRTPGGPIYYEFSTLDELRGLILSIDELGNLVRLPGERARVPTSAACWRAVEVACDARLQIISVFSEHADDRYYQKRAIEETFSEFSQSQAKGMIIVGESGMGKTTLLVHLVSARLMAKDPCAIFYTGEFPLELSTLETHLANRLGRIKLTDGTIPVGSFWSAIDEEGERRNQRVLVFIDAINEYNQGRDDPRLVDLMSELDLIIANLKTKFNRVKFVVTCRTETWRRALLSARTCFRNAGIFFTPSKKDIAWVLSKFSPEEFKGAYEKYQRAAQITTSFEQLSPLARYHLRAPFLLRLATEVYKNGEIPRELDTGELFEKYYNELKCVGPSERDLQPLIDELVDEMFVGHAGAETIQRNAFPLNRDLKDRKSGLYNDLNFSDRKSLGYELREKNIIREWQTRTGRGMSETRMIRFTYDRFAEYLLAKRLLLLIEMRAKGEETLPQAAKAIFQANIPRSQHDPVVHGSLQLTCQWLVSSALARTSTGSIQLLDELLKQLGKIRSNSGKRFPVIDTVYRILTHRDYRLWLERQNNAIQRAHLKVLYDHFIRAFQDRDMTISAAAVQYAFSLWSSPSIQDYKDGLEITTRLAQQVVPLSQMALSRPMQHGFRSFTTLMILVLSEAPKERFMDAIGVGREIVRRLNLRKWERIASFLPKSVFLKYFLSFINNMPNPVRFDPLERYYKNRNRELAAFEQIVKLLDPASDSPLTIQTLKRLSQTDNSLVHQMLTYVVSVNYERAASPKAQAEVLALVEDWFYEEPRSQIYEYCSSLALYQINAFGSRASRESMQLMGRMTKSILKERQGRFTIRGRNYSYNIIGTYGRSLRRYYRSGMDTEVMESPALSPMQYAVDALRDAIEVGNAELYLSICRELRLLGAMVEPEYLLDVFAEILKDVQALDETGSGLDRTFSPNDIEKSKDTILQSLANARVLYRQQVDNYLSEMLERPEIYAEVATKRTPEFRLSYLFSWAFEQLLFRFLAYHYEEIGREFTETLLDAARCPSPVDCVRLVLSRAMKRLAELSE